MPRRCGITREEFRSRRGALRQCNSLRIRAASRVDDWRFLPLAVKRGEHSRADEQVK